MLSITVLSMVTLNTSFVISSCHLVLLVRQLASAPPSTAFAQRDKLVRAESSNDDEGDSLLLLDLVRPTA